MTIKAETLTRRLQKEIDERKGAPSNVGYGYEAGRFGYALAGGMRTRKAFADRWRRKLIKAIEENGTTRIDTEVIRGASRWGDHRAKWTRYIDADTGKTLVIVAPAKGKHFIYSLLHGEDADARLESLLNSSWRRIGEGK